MKGKFITVEGSDGSGKTTFINSVTEYLVKKGYKVITTREPGGTEFSEKVRELLFDSSNEIDAKTESLLFCVSRRDHIIKKIIPYVEEGYIVICDRFVDSSIDVEIGLSRTKGRDENNRMDNESLKFYKDVKRGYDELSNDYKKRIKVIDANQDYEKVEKDAFKILEGFLNNEF